MYNCLKSIENRNNNRDIKNNKIEGESTDSLYTSSSEDEYNDRHDNIKKIKKRTDIENEIILLKNIRPFPTIYWLINKNICGYISHLEKINIIKNIENFINHPGEEFKLLRYYLIYDHLKYIVIRLRHIHKRILIFFYNYFLNSEYFISQHKQNNHLSNIDLYKNNPFSQIFEITPIIQSYYEKYPIDFNSICEILRKINTLRIKGIGGISNFLTLKCIHLYFASHLSYPNTVGYIIEEYFKS
ncbi:hypothetical protein PFLG_03178 [Plasmodium falciparum RAJ116]|uniref:Uncharacterized protein n=1 Tax=Plasmodium falciparum RAJ116 TaxID=580058 RepID=A0A0L0D0V5_PLAFA|nr:hypothetical protein PFLG_03178 [Plasmodium falciparum RAJ116]